MSVSDEDMRSAHKRLLMVTRICKQMVVSQTGPMFDEEAYPIIVAAFMRAEDDVNEMFTELTILRGMVADKVASWSKGNGESADDPRPVEEAGTGAAIESGTTGTNDSEGVGVAVPQGGPVRKRRGKRSKSRGHKEGVSVDTQAVD